MTGRLGLTAVLICVGTVVGFCAAADGPVEVYVFEPISTRMILPDTPAPEGEVSNEISIVATPGEYEPGSFVVRAKSDIKGLRVETGDLKCREKVISADCVDVKVVKCWYQATAAWSGIHTRPKEARKVLVPELLLNDDTLIKVDHKAKRNYIKLRFDDGERYVWVSDPNEPDGDKMKVMTVGEYPVRDSERLEAVDIAAGTNKQFWVTVGVGEDAAAGDYEGAMALRLGGRTVGRVVLRVKVAAYKLSEPRTHYDLSRPFVSSIYYRGVLNEKKPEGSVSSEHKSERQLRAELLDMCRHGITNPTCYQRFDEKLLGRYLEIRREVGMKAGALYYLGVSANSKPESIRRVKEFAAEYGFEDVYFYGIDEAQGDRLKKQRAKWEATRGAGGKVFVAGGIKRNFEAMGDVQDLHICAGRAQRAEAERWHSVGHDVFCYADPQGGPEDPDLWRRNFGLSLWLTDYDGACTYCYQHSFGNVWNDFDHYHYRDHTLAYPTVDGVIDTIALEGYREAIDDIRYATTLMIEVRKAVESGDTGRKAKADEAAAWLNGLDARAENPSATRSKIIDYTLGLTDM